MVPSLDTNVLLSCRLRSSAVELCHDLRCRWLVLQSLCPTMGDLEGSAVGIGFIVGSAVGSAHNRGSSPLRHSHCARLAHLLHSSSSTSSQRYAWRFEGIPLAQQPGAEVVVDVVGSEHSVAECKYTERQRESERE